ncbi:hypothetical protein, partial [Paracraurococcus lichenis]
MMTFREDGDLRLAEDVSPEPLLGIQPEAPVVVRPNVPHALTMDEPVQQHVSFMLAAKDLGILAAALKV